MIKGSFFLEFGEPIVGNQVFYHLLFSRVIACTQVCLQRQPMLLRLIAVSKSFTIQGLYRGNSYYVHSILDSGALDKRQSTEFENPFYLFLLWIFCYNKICRTSPSEFVIPWSKYRKAVYFTHMSVGMRFRMVYETEESTLRR